MFGRIPAPTLIHHPPRKKKLSAVVRDYKQFLSETENTTLRTKLDQLQVGRSKHFLERKFSKDGKKSITSAQLLGNIPRSKTSMVSEPSGSGKSTLAANITVNWAESEEDNSYQGVIYLSPLNTMKSSTLYNLVWGEFAFSSRITVINVKRIINFCFLHSLLYHSLFTEKK